MSARVHVVHESGPSQECVLHSIERAGARAVLLSPAHAARTGAHRDADAVVIVSSSAPASSTALPGVLAELSRRPRATLLLRPAGTAPLPAARRRRVPLTQIENDNPDALHERLVSLIDVGHAVRRPRPRRRAPRAIRIAENLTRQLQMASHMQRELLPMRLPACGPLTFSAVYQPIEYVSGDLLDLQRIDEEHVAVAVADVAGHGMPAALLTMFVKRALLAPQGFSGPRQVVPPATVVERLNEELSACALPGCEFVALAYALINVRTRVVELVRAGLPYPLLRRNDSRLEVVRRGGPVLGMLPGAEFESVRLELHPGDELLLFTDGVDQLLQLDPHAPTVAAQVRAAALQSATDACGTLRATGTDGRAPGARRRHAAPRAGFAGCQVPTRSTTRGIGCTPSSALPAAACAAPGDVELLNSPWHTELRRGLADGMNQLALRHDALRRVGRAHDDLTALTIRMTP